MLLQRSSPEEIYVQSIAWTGSGSAAGTAIAARLVGALIDSTSWHARFVATAVTIAMVPFVAILLPQLGWHSDREAKQKANDGRRA